MFLSEYIKYTKQERIKTLNLETFIFEQDI